MSWRRVDNNNNNNYYYNNYNSPSVRTNHLLWLMITHFIISDQRLQTMSSEKRCWPSRLQQLTVGLTELVIIIIIIIIII